MREAGRLSDFKLQGNVTVVETDLFLLCIKFHNISHTKYPCKYRGCLLVAVANVMFLEWNSPIIVVGTTGSEHESTEN